MQYSNRPNYKNRSERSFYPSRQYNNNSENGNPRYENPEYKNLEYENSEEFDEMSITRASQEVYYNKYSNENMFYDIEEYYKNSDFQYFIDFFSYHMNNEE